MATHSKSKVLIFSSMSSVDQNSTIPDVPHLDITGMENEIGKLVKVCFFLVKASVTL